MTDGLTIRPARPDDGERLWHWRNDPAVRRASLNQNEIPLEEHLGWYRRALSDPNREILVAEVDGQPMGMVRFDRDGNTATVSILLAAGFRGKRMAGPVLAAAIRVAKAGQSILRALVRQDNPASRALFLSQGFRVVSEGEVTVLERSGDTSG